GFGEDNGARSRSSSSESDSDEVEGEMDAERFLDEALRIPFSNALVGEAVELVEWAVLAEQDDDVKKPGEAHSSIVAEFLREDEVDAVSLSLDDLRMPFTPSTDTWE